MSFEFNGETIETTATGFLVDQEVWTEELAKVLAKSEGITLTDAHMDVIKLLREEFFNNNGNQPNTRNIVKGMEEIWGREVSSKELYDLFPLDPSKQGGRIAGLPESRRKGGY
ncbi:MAG: TusE/DsrC/DsvC family sulfur relay protein [Gammaproteobacteria bacterium]|nr:TusE/DsrC/DsvC family sulfur relay protein [Gammaproteobacteria bacterium]